jgi:two-component system, OmpR family, phosphate regulon sensor histidine kinase PhoR
VRGAPKAGGAGPGRPRLGARAKLKGALAFASVIALLVGIWSGLRVLAIRLGLAPSSWGGGLLVLVSTLVAFGVAANVAGIFIRKRHPDYFAALSDAIRRLATGDFDVELSLPDLGRGGDFFGKVAGEINLLAQSLKKMEDMRQEFISTASHEIQSPLTSIAGFAKALREEGLPEETRLRYLGIIEDESNRLSRLSEGLLRLTALESWEPEPDAEPVALDEQIRRVVIAAEPQWTAKALELDLDLERVEARVDEGMLSQVWTNLFHNAVKFSSDGGRISISLRREACPESGGASAGGGLAVAVFSDEGAGIAAEDLSLVFDRFFKADRSRTRSDPSSGNGLGLAIAKKIVELHGGRIRAESPGVGRGSAFTVELPIAQALPP